CNRVSADLQSGVDERSDCRRRQRSADSPVEILAAPDSCFASRRCTSRRLLFHSVAASHTIWALPGHRLEPALRANGMCKHWHSLDGTSRRLGFVVPVLLVLAVSQPAVCQGLDTSDPKWQSGYIPMKDGVRLAYILHRPRKDGQFPVLLNYNAE